MPHYFLPASIAVFALSLAPLVQAQECPGTGAARAYVSTSPVMPATVSSTDAHEGRVSYYSHRFVGRKTSSGERFEPNALTMAHKTLPFGTMVRVTNLQNYQSIIVRVNDRGPHIADRVGDVSPGAARMLMMLRSGVVKARLEVMGVAEALKLR